MKYRIKKGIQQQAYLNANSSLILCYFDVMYMLFPGWPIGLHILQSDYGVQVRQKQQYLSWRRTEAWS